MNILVLGGGHSSEREVSLRSAAAVREGLANIGHNVTFVDTAEGDEAIRTAAASADLVFPILHGPGDEDGTQETLDLAGTPYLGSGAVAAKLCMDKAEYKELLIKNGVSAPNGEVVTSETFAKSSLIHRPFILKPIANGSSVDMLIGRHLPFDAEKAKELLGRYEEMLLEELIEGIEITVAVLGDAALPVIEIIPPQGQEFDYENKYNGATVELCPPRHVDADTQLVAQKLAIKVHELTECRHLSRTDMFVRPDGSLVVLETNTMPGLTAQSLFPKAAAVAGLSWTDLMTRFVELSQVD